MEGLIRSCVFTQEWEPDADTDVGSRLANFAAGSGAYMAATGAFKSFYVKEARQSDVRRLPTGARTLLLDPSTGDVLVRGVNKFLDMEAVDPAWADDPALWAEASVWLQRKMAGFVVTLFSLDGVELGVATKHVVAGPHVDLVHRILEGMLSPPQRAALAADLFSMGAAVTGEAIALDDDGGHPVLESAEHDGAIVFFSVHRRAGGREQCVPFAEARRHLARWALPAVPAWRAMGRAQLDEWLRPRATWRPLAPDGRPLAEGFVVVVELPTARVALALGKAPPPVGGGPFSVAPLRLKAKTVKYRVLRALRSIARGESSAQPLQFHEAFALWAVHVAGKQSVPAAIEESGVSALYAEFEAFAAAHAGTQHPGAALTVGDAFARLVATAEHEAAALLRAPLHVAMLCGLPGSGKSSLARAIAAAAAAGGAAFRHVLRLSRDEVAADVARRDGLDALSPRRRERRLRLLVHHAVVAALHRLVALSLHLEGPTLLILDACHAAADARQRFRALLPRDLDSFTLFHVACDDRALLARRLARRTGHETLNDAAAAQAALFSVRAVFEAPAPGDACVRLDASAAAADELARCVLARYGPARGLRAAVYDFHSARAELKARRGPLIAAVVGPQRLAACEWDAAALLRPGPHPAAGQKDWERAAGQKDWERAAGRRLGLRAARVDAGLDALTEAAAGSLARAVGGEASAVPAGWWKRCREALGFGETAKRDRVVAGHTRWLRGFFIREGRNNWKKALEEHYECRPSAPHVTVAVGDACAVVPGVLAVGSTVSVRVESVVLDHSALCFRASIDADGQHFTHQFGKEKQLAMHVTLGHTAKVKAVYAGTMLDLLEKWENHNKDLEKARLVEGGVKRSRNKFVNFVEISLETPLAFRGVMVEAQAP